MPDLEAAAMAQSVAARLVVDEGTCCGHALANDQFRVTHLRPGNGPPAAHRMLIVAEEHQRLVEHGLFHKGGVLTGRDADTDLGLALQHRVTHLGSAGVV